MDTPQSRGQASGISDWTALDSSLGSSSLNVNVNGTPPPLPPPPPHAAAPKVLPSHQAMRTKQRPIPRSGDASWDDHYDAGQCAGDEEEEGDGIRTQHTTTYLDERLRERLKTTVCWMSPDDRTSRCPPAAAAAPRKAVPPPHSGGCPNRRRTVTSLEDTDSSGGKAVSSKVPPALERQRPSDAESFRLLLGSSASTSCNTPRRQRAKSKFEALSDSESLRILEYWTQKRSGEKNWE